MAYEIYLLFESLVILLIFSYSFYLIIILLNYLNHLNLHHHYLLIYFISYQPF